MPLKQPGPDTPQDAHGSPGPPVPAEDEVRLQDGVEGASGEADGLAEELHTVLSSLGSVLGATAARVTVAGREVAGWTIDDAVGPVGDQAPVDVATPVGGETKRSVRTVRRELLTRHVADAAVELELPLEPPAPGAERGLIDALTLAVSRILDCDAVEADLETGALQREHFLIALQHELRTPATALMLEAGLLQSGMLGHLPPKLQSTLERLERQVGDFLRVVQRVLDMAQVESLADGRADVVDVREAVLAVARNAEPEASRKGVVFSLFFPRTIPAIQTDEDRFRRVVNHLLANAVKYSGPGRVQIRVERAMGAGGLHALLVRIADCGPGIPASELERVFQPFAQVEEGARTDSRSRGIGLGLSVARRLARSIGGEVTVESVVGTGTIATFSVPLRPHRDG